MIHCHIYDQYYGRSGFNLHENLKAGFLFKCHPDIMLTITERKFDFKSALHNGSEDFFFARAALSSDETVLYSIDREDFNLIHSITCSEGGELHYKSLRNKRTNIKPPTTFNYGSLIYHDDQLIMFGGCTAGVYGFPFP